MAKKIEAITPEQLQTAALNGIKKLRGYRKARTKFLEEYVGQYYSGGSGSMGERPINLIFNAIRILVPNYVMKNPKVQVRSLYPQYTEYAKKLSLAVESLNDKLDLKYLLRSLIVDALFGFGIARTGLANSENLVEIDGNLIDMGQVFTKRVDLDNAIIDPSCKSLTDVRFFGETLEIPKYKLLELDGVNKDLVEKLTDRHVSDTNSAEEISKRNQYGGEFNRDLDIVRVAQVWIREANAIVLFPDPEYGVIDEYIRVSDYYGPDGGPYTILSLTPPVPNNPLPISTVGIWHDLHVATNRSFRKMMDQIDRQKDVIGYSPSAIDTAQEILDAEDGDMVPMQDPTAVNTFNFGGQNPQNEQAVSTLQNWFNIMSGNTEQLSGASTSETATEAQINQANANISIEDGRDLLYDFTAEINRKQAWYLHTDPLIEIPLVRREPGKEDEYILLTPEDRQGSFLDYDFKIEIKSMSKISYALRAKRVVDFSTRIIPAVINSANIAQQMGMPFNAKIFIQKLAEEMDIADWMTDIFNDPEFANRLAMQSAMGPQPNGNATKADGLSGILQNGQDPTMAAPAPTEQQTNNQFAQQTAAIAQEEVASPPAQGGY